MLEHWRSPPAPPMVAAVDRLGHELHRGSRSGCGPGSAAPPAHEVLLRWPDHPTVSRGARAAMRSRCAAHTMLRRDIHGTDAGGHGLPPRGWSGRRTGRCWPNQCRTGRIGTGAAAAPGGDHVTADGDYVARHISFGLGVVGGWWDAASAMTRHTTFKFCLDPTVEQHDVLSRHAGAARFAFNQCLRMVRPHSHNAVASRTARCRGPDLI